ncbi:MAG: PfkB family carbohydrate kinase [Gammaproteobacteria bacterium]|nr:PfkB family carbohydrate kinase [Gammaproteobacteria bacterium]MDH5801337.1 PfkB family carbohydrate kinase [Gammaproteobacteria bacterium]
MKTETKIFSLLELGSIANGLRQEGKNIVLCHGTFDLLHIGHIRHIESAAKEGDVLFVTITADDFIIKGPGRPVFNEQLRSEHLAALSAVSGVAVVHHASGLPAIQAIQPHVYVKGGDYKTEDDLTGNILREKQAVEANGGRIVFTDEITYSSSKLINDYFDVFLPETKSYLEKIKQHIRSDDVIGCVQSLYNLKVLVIGDAIVDEYCYADTLGQTGKYNVLSVKYKDRELFAGGAIAVANHVAGVVDEVTLFSGLGDYNSHENFIRSKLKPNIHPEFIYFEKSPTLVKRRYVDADMAKLFEVYEYNDHPLDGEKERNACCWLNENIENFDLVLVSDFGNGFITDAMVNVICNKAKTLAVNTQLNSGNRGYHVINRYSRADFVSLNEPEIRMAAHDKSGRLEDIMVQTAAKLRARHVAVTKGRKGIQWYDSNKNQFHSAAALSTKVVDRIGAGDAFLSYAGVSVAGGLDTPICSFVGAAAAALDVQIVCNRDSVDPVALYKYVTTLLK